MGEDEEEERERIEIVKAIADIEAFVQEMRDAFGEYQVTYRGTVKCRDE